MPDAPAPRPRAASFRRILLLARPELRSLVAGTVFLVIGSGTGLVFPQKIGAIVNEANEKGLGSLGETDGLAFCRSLPELCGVVAVPNVVFYDDVAEGGPLVRFAFCKRHEVIDEAVARLKGLKR